MAAGICRNLHVFAESATPNARVRRDGLAADPGLLLFLRRATGDRSKLWRRIMLFPMDDLVYSNVACLPRSSRRLDVRQPEGKAAAVDSDGLQRRFRMLWVAKSVAKPLDLPIGSLVLSANKLTLPWSVQIAAQFPRASPRQSLFIDDIFTSQSSLLLAHAHGFEYKGSSRVRHVGITISPHAAVAYLLRRQATVPFNCAAVLAHATGYEGSLPHQTLPYQLYLAIRRVKKTLRFDEVAEA